MVPPCKTRWMLKSKEYIWVPKARPKRIDAWTGKTLTYEELVSTYKKQYKRREIEDYWHTMKRAKVWVPKENPKETVQTSSTIKGSVLLGRCGGTPTTNSSELQKKEAIAEQTTEEVVEAIATKVLGETFAEKVVGFVRGKMTKGQEYGEEREVCGRGEIPMDAAIACQKGRKGPSKDAWVNQDNFSVTHFNSGYTLVCTCDGHGQFGHIVSTRAVQTVPWFMVNESGFDKDTIDEASIEEALVNAFEKAHLELLAYAEGANYDFSQSGTTALAVLFKKNKVWTANAGDSRCLIYSKKDNKILFQTADHTAGCVQEKARIESMGGEVRSKTYPDGYVSHRIFVRGEDVPGLETARSLGDQAVKSHGVIATPEVVKTEVDLQKEVFFIAATDGIWQFLLPDEVVTKASQQDSPQDLPTEARNRWETNEGDICDDITSIVVHLPTFGT